MSNNHIQMSTNQKPNVILFDGVCNLCSGFVQFVLKNEEQKNILFASLQSKAAQVILRENGLPSHEMNTIVFIENEKIYTKSKAVLKIMDHMKYPWKSMVILKVFPSELSDYIYDLIAKHRYRILGKKDTCWIPTQELKARFLED